MDNLDLSYIESVTEGDKGLIIELINIFKEQVPEFTSEFNSAFANKETEVLKQIAHKAKSTVAIMGLNELTAILAKFEIEAEEGVFADHFQSYIDTFIDHCHKAIKILEEHYQ